MEKGMTKGMKTDEIIVRCGTISMGQIHNEFSTQVQNTGMRYRFIKGIYYGTSNRTTVHVYRYY